MIRRAVGRVAAAFGRGRMGFVPERPILYLVLVAVSILAAYIYSYRRDGIFACQADGYSSDHYLSYCEGKSYGDYEHGVFWLNLEPGAVKSAAAAQVLFLGDSRLQIAFSAAATTDWFTAAAARYYILGFGYRDNVVFTEPLLRKMNAQAKVYVINADSFFETDETPPARIVMSDPWGPLRYRVKRFWQGPHEFICTRVTWICGHRFRIFRSRETGAAEANEQYTRGSVSYDTDAKADLVQKVLPAAAGFLSRQSLPRECVIFTAVPYGETYWGMTKGLADAAGANFIAPQVEDLRTFDGYHLDRPSAQRWSRAFLEAAGPQIKKCLGVGARAAG